MRNNLVQLSVNCFSLTAYTFDDTEMPRTGESFYDKCKVQVGDVYLGNKLTMGERNEIIAKQKKAKILYHSNHHHSFMEIICTPTEALKYMIMSKSNLINTALEMFDFQREQTEEEARAESSNSSRPWRVEDECVKYLQQIIKECPKVVVEKAKVMKPKELKKMFTEYFKTNRNVVNYTSVDLLYQYAKMYHMLEMAAVDCGKSEVYQYPETYKQYAALSLMQTYGSPYNSCQYLPIHEFALSDVERYIEGLDSYSFKIQVKNESPNFCIDQRDDFLTAKCDRFFALNSKGFVEKRFSVHYSTKGETLLSNFYNSTPVTALKVGNVQVENVLRSDAVNFDHSGESYCNNYYATVESQMRKIENLMR